MYESIGYTLQQFMCFAAAGFAFGLLYEPLRFFRRLVRHNTVCVAIEDVLFFSLAACVSFIISLEVGIGYFRVFYIVSEIIGGAIYFLTVGRLISFVNKAAAKFFKRVTLVFFRFWRDLTGKFFSFFVHKAKPVFVKCDKILHCVINNVKKPLQNGYKMLYNNKEPEKSREGVSRNVIKAEVRKKA